MNKPRISVIMPAYNHERYIGEAIESVLSQSFSDLELIIVDDGSSDDTATVAAGFPDKRIRLCRQDNQGCHRALNRGVGMAQGKYIAILNSDDTYLPGRLERLYGLAEGSELRFLISDMHLIDQNSRVINDPSHWWLKWYGNLKASHRICGSAAKSLLMGNFAVSSSNFFFDAKLPDEIGLFRKFRYILDYEYAFRAAWHLQDKFLYLVDEQLMGYRLHDSNTINENPLKANVETFFFLKKAISHVYGNEVGLAIKHVDRIKRYLIKEENALRFKTIDALARSNDGLNRANEELNHSNVELNHSNVELNRANEELTHSNVELNRANVELNHSNVELNRANEELNRSNQALSVSNKGLNIANVELDQCNHVLLGKNQELQRANADLSGKIDALKQENAGLDADKHTFVNENAELLRRLDDERRELVLMRNSRSFKLGKALMLPLVMVKNAWQARKAQKQFREKVNGVDALRAQLEKTLNSVTVVSFDIFDTIFERDIDPPDMLKMVSARHISRFIKERLGKNYPAEDVCGVRNEIEAGLRQEAASRGMDYECLFSDLAERWARRLGGDQHEMLKEVMIEHELRIESEALYLKPGMLEIIQWLKRKGKKVIAISDMYLDREHLQQIFRGKGIEAYFDALYVSSELAKCKYSGRLFHHVLEEIGAKPEDMVHIGDNRHSDHIAPISLGIHSIYLDDKISHKRRLMIRAYAYLAARNRYWRGRHLMQSIRPRLRGDFFHDFSFSFLGPVYCSFVLGVIEDVKKQGIRQVYFLAREGELFQKIFDILAPYFFEKDERPVSRYLYVSRKSVAAAAAFKGLSFERAIIPLYNPKQKGMASICKAMGLPVEAFDEIVRQHGYQSVEQPIYDWHSTQFAGMIGDAAFQEIVTRCASDQYSAFRAYLRQECFFGEAKVALVDIGWNGSIQKFIQDAYLDEPGFPCVFGYYLAFCNGMKHAFDENKNVVQGLIYDQRNSKKDGAVLTYFEEIFEEGARALHPTTVSYRENEKTGKVEPQLKDDNALDRQEEIGLNQTVAALHEGAINFSHEFARSVDLTNYSFEDIRPFIVTMLERSVAFPTREEARRLLQITHSDDFGFESVMSFSADIAQGGYKNLLQPEVLKALIARSNWKYGTASSLGIAGYNTILRFKDVRDNRLYG